MQSQLESDRHSTRTNIITTDRPDSSQLVDLHVYIVPKTIWKDHQNLAENEAMEQAVSAGFVRVSQNLTIQQLRQHILNVCGQDDEFPKEFIYLRSVGRCFTKVKPQQETDLRVKNYRPPMTFAPEIYLIEGNHDDSTSATPNSKSYLYRESPIQQALVTPPQLQNRQQSWIKPLTDLSAPTLLTNYPSFIQSGERQNSINFTGLRNASFSNFSTASSTLSPRDLAKLREEQERLRLRQIELARQRREIEQEQQRRAKELLEKQKNTSKERQRREEAAAICIQATYRGYRTRRDLENDRQQRELAGNEIERLQKEARELARRKAEQEHVEEIQAHDVAKLSDHLEALKAKRVELEASRETIVRRMQQLHAQISVRRKEERDTWKQKYLLEKKKTTALEEKIKDATKDEPDLNFQIEQAKLRLTNAAKLRQQAEAECRTLKQELHQIRVDMNILENPSLTKQSSSLQQPPQPPPPPPPQQQQQQPTIPINLDITLQY